MARSAGSRPRRRSRCCARGRDRVHAGRRRQCGAQRRGAGRPRRVWAGVVGRRRGRRGTGRAGRRRDRASRTSSIDRPAPATIVKTRFVAGGQQLLRLDEEEVAVGAVEHADRPCALQGLRRDPAVRLRQGRGHRAADPLGPAGRPQRTGAPVIVDPKGRDFARYGAVDLIKPNAAELAGATGLPVETDAEIEAALAGAAGRHDGQGHPGHPRRQGHVAWRGAASRCATSPAAAREVFDVSGAGDTGLAALGSGARRRAHRWSRRSQFAILAVRRRGRQGRHGRGHARRTDRGRDEPARLAPRRRQGHRRSTNWPPRSRRWRRQGLKVGFTNGCFDILHRGHVAYLAQARGWCDRLVVALNTDASVRALKGEGRPVNDLDSRAVVSAAWPASTVVAAFDEPTPLALIEAAAARRADQGRGLHRATAWSAATWSRAGAARCGWPTFVDGYSTTADHREA